MAVLKDDARRAEMIAVLETLAAAGPHAAAGPASAAQAAAGSPAAAPARADKLAIPLAPDSLGAQLLVGASEHLEALSSEVGDTVRTLTNFTLLERWVKALAADPESRAELLDASWKLLVVAAVALLVEVAVGRLIRRPRRALMRFSSPSATTDATTEAITSPPALASPPKPDHVLATQRRSARRARTLATVRRVPLTLGRLLLDLLPVLTMAAVGYGLLGTRLGEPNTTKLVILALLNAYVLCRLVIMVARAVLSPDAPGLRLLPIDDQMSATALRWLRRVAIVALFGYALTEAALLLGLYRVAHDALLKLVALAVHLMLVVVVLQNRAPVARLIRADPDDFRMAAALRNRLAAVWHIIVIFYIVALWVVWALDVPGGFAKLLLVFVSTTLIVNLARVLSILLVAWLDHAVALDAPSGGRSTGFDATGLDATGFGGVVRRYLPALRTLLEAAIGLSAFVVLMEIWGLDSLSWFRSDALGGRLLAAVLTSATTIAIGLLIWEASNIAVQNHLARLAREGQPARSARLRTLLPMLRTTLLVAISLFAGLTVLSQIGVNIAPLLAGAGVVGLAIGFGSQKLVQDIITGLFLLLENTMQVGDVVTLGGLTGTVENLSIRVIRLRALDGAVHIVPFSAVTTVTNLTRDFAYAMLDVSVGLNEEPDRIGEVITALAETLRTEQRWAAAITDDMEIMGVERFIDTAWVLRCRIKTVPSQRWAVSRELNRRLKYRFDELAIESPFTSYRALSAPPPPPPNAKMVDEAARAAA